jgi:hypothetical protein
MICSTLSSVTQKYARNYFQIPYKMNERNKVTRANENIQIRKHAV